jgi:hypothetical protein
MKTSIAIVVLFASVLTAQEAPQPDYSRENLQRFVAAIPEAPKRERNFRFYLGGIEFGALGQNWRFGLGLMPLSGSIMRTTQEWPDPFSLTQTAIATPRRAWRTQRNVNAELRRIEKTERAKIRVRTE